MYKQTKLELFSVSHRHHSPTLTPHTLKPSNRKLPNRLPPCRLRRVPVSHLHTHHGKDESALLALRQHANLGRLQPPSDAIPAK